MSSPLFHCYLDFSQEAVLTRTIRRHEEKLAADLATAHARDPLIVGDGSDEPMAALARQLDALPDMVREMRRFPLGRHGGLAFGLVLHPGGAAEVYLEGASSRHGQLSRDHQGPRAVLNALDRLAASQASH